MQDDSFLTEEQRKERKREKWGQAIAYVFAVLIFGGYALWSLGFGIYGVFMAEHMTLSELGNAAVLYAVYEGDLGEVSDVSTGGKAQFFCEMEHTINGLIPYAHEYFYVIMMDDQQKAIPVRAGKHWGENLSSGVSSIPIKGQIRRMNHYEVENRLKAVVENNSEFFAGYQVETDYYIDLTATRMNVLHIIVGISLLVAVVGSIMYAKEDNSGTSDSGKEEAWIRKPPVPQIVLALFIAGACLTVYVISLG